MGFASARKRRRRQLSGTDLTREEIQLLYEWLTAGVMKNPRWHAEALAQGKTAFRNLIIKAFREMRATCRHMIDKGERRASAMEVLVLADRFGTDTAVEYAWHIFSGVGWRNTLAGISQQVGFALPWNTTPDMVIRYLVEHEPTLDDNPIMTVRSNLDEAKHAETWEGSARERTGTYAEIMGSSKLPEIDRGLAAGTHQLVDDLGRKVVPSEMKERAERAERDRAKKGAA